MSPLDYIKEGILSGNWETICEGYERLTGEALQLPTDSPNETKRAMEVLSQIREIASDFIEGPTAEICDTPKKKKKKPGPKKGSRNRTNKKTPTVTKDGEDSSLELDDSKKTIVQKECGGTQLITNTPDPEEVEKNRIAAEKAKGNKLQLTRPDTSKKYKVKCNECDNKFESDRPDGGMGQKCPKCLGDKKSRFS